MRNKDRTLYRVDRCVQSPVAPAGMLSILYVGSSLPDAMHVFNHSDGGVDVWGKPDPAYGVGLFVWHQADNEYKVKQWKNK